jgi:N-sulfoglucosamine sulfohydrolase
MAKTLYPILRQVVRLAAHRASAVIGLAWSDSKSIENPAERRRPGGYELFVDDPDGLTARGMEPVLPSGIPFDNAATRCDMASFKASARSLDQGVGTVLNALEENGVADQTLVVLTTDHGLAYPDANATMFDSGIGTILLMRGPGV